MNAINLSKKEYKKKNAHKLNKRKNMKKFV